MQQTVVGVFDSLAEANQAVSTLSAKGVARDRVQVSESTASVATASSSAAQDDGVMSHVKHFFSDLFGNEDHAAPYAEAVRRGGAIVKVNVEGDDELNRATEALDDAGAVDIEERANQWRAQGWQGAAQPASTGMTSAAGASAYAAQSRDNLAGNKTSADVIPVIKEELEVGKRTVGTGGVRVYARTVSTPVTESIGLRSEHAQVERRPVDRAATAADLKNLHDRTIEVKETAERAVVSKTARVVEEVSVAKTVEERTENISDNLRHTEVEVEHLSPEESYSKFDSAYQSDFATRYGASGASYGDFEPAYRFGHGLRSDARYAGRPWNDIEGDVRRDWEQKNPTTAWDKVKAAVSHAWNKVAD